MRVCTCPGCHLDLYSRKATTCTSIPLLCIPVHANLCARLCITLEPSLNRNSLMGKRYARFGPAAEPTRSELGAGSLMFFSKYVMFGKPWCGGWVGFQFRFFLATTRRVDDNPKRMAAKAFVSDSEMVLRFCTCAFARALGVILICTPAKLRHALPFRYSAFQCMPIFALVCASLSSRV